VAGSDPIGHQVKARLSQEPECYIRAGRGSLDKGEISNLLAEHKHTDFEASGISISLIPIF
jgi:hypothetical protein